MVAGATATGAGAVTGAGVVSGARVCCGATNSCGAAGAVDEVSAGTIWIWRVVPCAAAVPSMANVIAAVRMHRDGRDMVCSFVMLRGHNEYLGEKDSNMSMQSSFRFIAEAHLQSKRCNLTECGSHAGVLMAKKGAAGLRGERPAAREPGLGTGRGGDVTGSRSSFFFVQRDAAVDTAGRGSPSETQTFGSDCDWRLTKR